MWNEKGMENISISEWYTPYIWCIRHFDVVGKMLGFDSCSKVEWKKMQEFLYSEKQFNLFALSLFRYASEVHITENDINTQVHYGLRVYFSQLTEFVKWCDKIDVRILRTGKPAFDMLRFSYIAYSVRYNELGFMLASKFNDKDLREIYNILNNINVKTELMFRKWCYNFCKKQKDTYLKNRLMKKMKLHENFFIRDSPDRFHNIFSVIHTKNY